MLKLKYFPNAWKIAIVCLILKPGANVIFPGISLVSCFSKFAERVIYNHLQFFFHGNNVVIPEQVGFRNQHNTTIHQLLRVVEVASEGLQTRNITGALFLDISKAFHRISHVSLIHKLIKLEMPYALVHFLRNYFTVRIRNS